MDQLNDEQNEEQVYKENDDLIAQIEDQIRECEDQVDDMHDFIENLDSNNKMNNESDEESDNSIHEMDENQIIDDQEKIPMNTPSVKRTRSGRAYVQNGIKMRPTDCSGRDRPRYNQPYLNRKKT